MSDPGAKVIAWLDDELEDALDSAQRMYPGTDTLLEAELKSGTRGKKGGGRLKDLLDATAGHATESPLEAKVARALRFARPHRMLKDDAWLRSLRTVLDARAPLWKLL